MIQAKNLSFYIISSHSMKEFKFSDDLERSINRFYKRIQKKNYSLPQFHSMHSWFQNLLFFLTLLSYSIHFYIKVLYLNIFQYHFGIYQWKNSSRNSINYSYIYILFEGLYFQENSIWKTSILKTRAIKSLKLGRGLQNAQL